MLIPITCRLSSILLAAFIAKLEELRLLHSRMMSQGFMLTLCIWNRFNTLIEQKIKTEHIVSFYASVLGLPLYQDANRLDRLTALRLYTIWGSWFSGEDGGEYLSNIRRRQMNVRKVIVMGSGLMGSGIAQVCAQAGIEVILNDVSTEALDRAMKSIDWSVGKFAEKGKLSEDRETVMKRVTATGDYAAGSDADVAIEAVYENMELKLEIFKKLDQVCVPQTLIASNTSSIPITELAAVTLRPEKVLGIHFFSPVPMMQAVEVIKGVSTSEETAQTGRDFVIQIGKEPIMVNRDIAGFVINRINFPSAIEAMNLVEQGVATVEDIDKGLRLASGRKMGIFETGDMVGLDVTYGAMMSIHNETGDPRFYPPLLLRRKVKAGQLGRKTGKGWYTYNADGTRKE
jgi:3-hydroxybutyryl-CoA dehydrogenase